MHTPTRRTTCGVALDEGATVSTQDRSRKRGESTPSTEDAAAAQAPATSEQASALAADMDDLLDEIDEVLEANAEEFVKSYVQKGGQ